MKRLNGIQPHILCCAACKRFYILSANAIDESLGNSVIEKHFARCKKCLYLENEGWIRRDLEVYKKILKLLITEEEKKPTVSSLIYILQPSDIGHLVEKIWKNQSCLSGTANANDLEFIRYNINEDWAPWNCMLVTRQEAVTLKRMPDIKKKYDADFKKCVLQRHEVAKSYFSTIPRFLPYISKSFLKNA
ncbi:IQ and ubiquitin-like domain-containing protein, partial [Stegodyphus dumicola]|uniref:IQ and ubiquitin-like domain-containing protein n=1 Tax=Stegodyphus dumicola TaxID=202533 RepID=UPI0015A8BC40